MIRILIIEDESISARNLIRILSEISIPNIVVGIIESVKDFIREYPKLNIDLILMDIHLLDGKAFQIFDKIEVNKPIIFTTAYDDYAIDAFQVNSIDYLLKPFRKEKLEKALEKYLSLYKLQNTFKISGLEKIINKYSFKKKFLIKIGKRLIQVETNQIAYFYVKNKSIYIKTFQNDNYLTDYSLSQIELEVDPEFFFRINRQFLINSGAIKNIYYESTSKLSVHLSPAWDNHILVSADKIGKFKNWLDQ